MLQTRKRRALAARHARRDRSAGDLGSSNGGSRALGSYIVRATSLSRCDRANTRRASGACGQGLPHRVGAYREIHRLLRTRGGRGPAASRSSSLENCETADLAARKRHWVGLAGHPQQAD